MSLSKSRKRKAAHWRKDPVILARLPRVERLHLAGKSNVAIAAIVGTNEITIRRDLLRLQELWLDRAGGKLEVLKAQTVAELEDIRIRGLQQADFDMAVEHDIIYGIDAEFDDVGLNTDDKGSIHFKGSKAASLSVARQASMDKAKVLGLIVDKKDIDANVSGLAEFLAQAFADDEPDAGEEAP